MNEGTAPSTSPKESRTSYLPPGLKNIVPYILVNGAARFIDFLKAAFEAEEWLRIPLPDGSVMHAEVAVGDSVIELGDANDKFAARPMTIHLYVKDADSTCGKALQAGATSREEVSDMPWGDRQGVVCDPFGNVWNIGMPKGWTPGPDGPRSVQPSPLMPSGVSVGLMPKAGIRVPRWFHTKWMTASSVNRLAMPGPLCESL